MCGLAGYMVGDAFAKARLDIAAASRQVAHRGPDDAGSLDEVWFGLAHRRLSIIDISDAASQPMKDVSGRYVLVFNGEIYNYRYLFNRYLSHVPGVNSNSDSSVLLHLYALLGPECLPLLDGMFAFAIVDRRKRQLFAARDRFGEKPFYWHHGNGVFAFASEVRALKALFPERSWSISSDAELIYHCIGSVPAPRTIIDGISALCPGHFMRFDGANIETKCFWSLPLHSVSGNSGHVDTKEAVKHELLQSVSSRLVSDVPVGLFLSGGYDSGALASAASVLANEPIQGLCLEFPEHEYSEAYLAQQTAQSFGLSFKKVRIDALTFLSGLDDFFRCMDQPTNDGYNTYFVCKAAKSMGIKVWLSGVGGDELFGGYPSFRRLGPMSALSQVMKVLPEWVVNAACNVLKDSHRATRVMHLADRGDHTTRAYQVLRNVIPLRLARGILRRGGSRLDEDLTTVDSIYPRGFGEEDAYQRASRLELAVYMRSQLLRDIDNFSMAHSLELRAPFLSHRLAELVVPLPAREKRAAGMTKPLLAKAIPRPLPAEVLNQQKRGFTFPIAQWLDTHLRDSFEEVVLDPICQSFWSPDEVRHIWKLYTKGMVGWAPVWQLYAYARWRLCQ